MHATQVSRACFDSTYAAAAPSRLVLAACMVCADPTTGEEVRGLCSNYLADVKPGDELVMTGPAGTALLLADNPWQKRIVCVSTGVCVCAGETDTGPFATCRCRLPQSQGLMLKAPFSNYLEVFSAADAGDILNTGNTGCCCWSCMC